MSSPPITLVPRPVFELRAVVEAAHLRLTQAQTEYQQARTIYLAGVLARLLHFIETEHLHPAAAADRVIDDGADDVHILAALDEAQAEIRRELMIVNLGADDAAAQIERWAKRAALLAFYERLIRDGAKLPF